MPSSRAKAIGPWTALVTILVVCVGGFWLYSHHQHQQLETKAMALTGGDPSAGRIAIGKYSCGGCHTIPGVAGAHGLVGPPLSQVGLRMYIGGELRNTPPNLIAWIKDPKAIEPHTAMPDMGVSDKDARDIAAYLYTLD